MLSVAAVPAPEKSLMFPRLLVPGMIDFPQPVSSPPLSKQDLRINAKRLARDFRSAAIGVDEVGRVVHPWHAGRDSRATSGIECIQQANGLHHLAHFFMIGSFQTE